MASSNSIPQMNQLRAVLRWPVFCDQKWCGDVVIFEAPASADPSTHDFLYDGVTPDGRAIGPFQKRGDAAVAIAARAVPQ